MSEQIKLLYPFQQYAVTATEWGSEHRIRFPDDCKSPVKIYVNTKRFCLIIGTDPNAEGLEDHTCIVLEPMGDVL